VAIIEAIAPTIGETLVTDTIDGIEVIDIINPLPDSRGPDIKLRKHGKRL